MPKTYKSKVDWWLALCLLLPILGGGAAIAAGVADDNATTMWVGVGSLGAFALLMFGLVVPMSYTLGETGLAIRHGMLRSVIPYERLDKAALSNNPLSSPALSLKRIRVDYRKPNDKTTFVLISPTDREAFLSDLAAASSGHELRDGEVVPAE